MSRHFVTNERIAKTSSMERITAHGIERTGCGSENFLLPGQSIITLSHLYKRESEVSLRNLLARQSSDKKRIAYLAEAAAEAALILNMMFPGNSGYSGAKNLKAGEPNHTWNRPRL